MQYKSVSQDLSQVFDPSPTVGRGHEVGFETRSKLRVGLSVQSTVHVGPVRAPRKTPRAVPIGTKRPPSMPERSAGRTAAAAHLRPMATVAEPICIPAGRNETSPGAGSTSRAGWFADWTGGLEWRAASGDRLPGCQYGSRSGNHAGIRFRTPEPGPTEKTLDCSAKCRRCSDRTASHHSNRPQWWVPLRRDRH